MAAALSSLMTMIARDVSDVPGLRQLQVFSCLKEQKETFLFIIFVSLFYWCFIFVARLSVCFNYACVQKRSGSFHRRKCCARMAGAYSGTNPLKERGFKGIKNCFIIYSVF